MRVKKHFYAEKFISIKWFLWWNPKLIFSLHFFERHNLLTFQIKLSLVFQGNGIWRSQTLSKSNHIVLKKQEFFYLSCEIFADTDCRHTLNDHFHFVWYEITKMSGNRKFFVPEWIQFTICSKTEWRLKMLPHAKFRHPSFR